MHHRLERDRLNYLIELGFLFFLSTFSSTKINDFSNPSFCTIGFFFFHTFASRVYTRISPLYEHKGYFTQLLRHTVITSHVILRRHCRCEHVVISFGFKRTRTCYVHTRERRDFFSSLLREHFKIQYLAKQN